MNLVYLQMKNIYDIEVFNIQSKNKTILVQIWPKNGPNVLQSKINRKWLNYTYPSLDQCNFETIQH